MWDQISRMATDAISRHPLTQVSKNILGQVVRSDPFQAARNAVLDRTTLGLPEKTFIKAMTGGDKQGVQLDNDQLARLKQAYNVQKNPAARPVVTEFDPTVEPFNTMTPEELQVEKKFYDENFRKYENDALARFNSPYVSTYGHNRDSSGYGRDLKMTFGGLSMKPTKQGGMRIYDKWDIDKASDVSGDHTTGIDQNATDSLSAIQDLTEGGSLPSIIANTARGLGTYEPIVTDIVIPRSEWSAITPREATIDERLMPNQGPILSRLNSMFGL